MIYEVNVMKTVFNVSSVFSRTTFNNTQFVGLLSSLTKTNKQRQRGDRNYKGRISLGCGSQFFWPSVNPSAIVLIQKMLMSQ